MKDKVHISPDIDIMNWMGSFFTPISGRKRIKLQEQTHQEMNQKLECHSYKGVEYCFCSLKRKVK